MDVVLLAQNLHRWTVPRRPCRSLEALLSVEYEILF